jgi:hypothetical protein
MLELFSRFAKPESKLDPDRIKKSFDSLISGTFEGIVVNSSPEEFDKILMEYGDTVAN